MTRLSVARHDRDAAGMTYVYPVVSRRAQGVSVGINLNPNNACNWRCIYCQVPDLTRGGPPPIDLTQLEAELTDLLSQLQSEAYMQQHVPAGMRQLTDIALSGNGEPTSCDAFLQVIELLQQVRQRFNLHSLKTRVITNGSLMHRQSVQQALALMSSLNGEVWFKVDRASEAAIEQVNAVSLPVAKVLRHLELAAQCCDTWVQTCWFALDGRYPSDQDEADYLALLQQALARQVPLQGVLLYGLARQSFQLDNARFQNLSPTQMDAWADKIRTLGLTVRVSY